MFKRGFIQDWESDYSSIMPYQFVCYGNFNNDELWSWCLANIGANMDWMVTLNGVIFRNEDDAVLFMLRWC